jgi:hypothetical protein
MDAAYYLFALPLILAPFMWEDEGDCEVPATDDSPSHWLSKALADDEEDYGALATRPVFYTADEAEDDDKEDYGALATRPVFYTADQAAEAPATNPVLHATPVAEAPKRLRKVFLSPRVTVYYFDKDVPATVKPRKLECFLP